MSFRLLGFLIFAIAPALSQESKSESGVEVRLLAEAVPDNLGKVFMQMGEAKSSSVVLPTNQLSKPLYCSDRTMALKTEDGGNSICSITLPVNGKSFVVVLVIAKSAGYDPIIVCSDDPAFKAGDVFFINRSNQTILGKLGGAQLILKPGESKKDRPTNPVEDTFYNIAFAIREPGGNKLISSSRWPIDNQLRSYVFFFNDAKGKTTFRAVDEYLVPAKP